MKNEKAVFALLIFAGLIVATNAVGLVHIANAAKFTDHAFMLRPRPPPVTQITNAPTSATSATFGVTSTASTPVGNSPGSGTGIVGLSSELCIIVGDVRDIVGIFALVLFLIGGVLYAAAHFMPSAGQIRGNLQGWAMGMIIGGVIGLILVIIAPSVVNIIAGFGGNGVIGASGC